MGTSEVHVLSASGVLPGPQIDNAALARRFGMPAAFEQWIDAFVGTSGRHLVVDLESGQATATLADLAAQAGAEALRSAGLGPQDVDLLVMATATPDKLMPATVTMVADRLGIDQVPAYQLQSGCTGAVQALQVAEGLLRCADHRTALVIGGDVCAKHLDVGLDLAAMPPGQLVNVVLFGDGAGAAVLGTRPGPGSAVLRRTLVRLVGLGRAPAQTVEWFGLADRLADLPAGSEDYKAIEQHVPGMADEVFAELLDELDWKKSEVDYLLPPQLSGTMTRRITERLSVSGAREISCVAETGNTANALPFFQLERLLPRMVEGDRAVGVTIESSKWIKAGFALEKQ
ncbi:3-oxoacyl-ACP synthase III family protein [Actinocrinis puniceicyclus]|uniref:3-oxoacyl-ACP synthase III family protein n=1 Tax=Actinocrinis puniceicyclus TaxID=977794 RepID=A0A8J7WP43_9ACTN|nr:3-oxoacyl-ACP synthase III family protein [Actinocrinis puniceicyclus]MBS2963687.1 3-oxoacyl-ACP synthase III family protein [Actinocrinis puniceicyclus]